MNTTKLSILANAKRVIELLEKEECGAELHNKMKELRRDTIRLEAINKNLIRSCNDCQKEFKATNSYEFRCESCKYEIRRNNHA